FIQILNQNPGGSASPAAPPMGLGNYVAIHPESLASQISHNGQVGNHRECWLAKAAMQHHYGSV
ncbi:hypothetical protein, partial [Rhodoblastus acidophilus]